MVMNRLWDTFASLYLSHQYLRNAATFIDFRTYIDFYIVVLTINRLF